MSRVIEQFEKMGFANDFSDAAKKLNTYLFSLDSTFFSMVLWIYKSML